MHVCNPPEVHANDGVLLRKAKSHHLAYAVRGGGGGGGGGGQRSREEREERGGGHGLVESGCLKGGYVRLQALLYQQSTGLLHLRDKGVLEMIERILLHGLRSLHALKHVRLLYGRV